MRRKYFYVFFFVIMLAFTAFISGGCGSSSSNLSAGNNGNDNNNNTVAESIIGKTVNLTLSGMDTDGDNKPDVADFDGVEFFYGPSTSTDSAADIDNAIIPFMYWANYLRDESDPDVIWTELTAGQAYTLEFTNNFKDGLGARLPYIKVTDPDGTELEPSKTASYPEGQPTSILFTYIPTTSGLYQIKLANGNLAAEDESQLNGIIFAYKELYGDDGTSTGYYTKFKVGSRTAELDEIHQLRKNFLNSNPDYLSRVYGEDNASTNDLRRRANDILPTESEGYDTWLSIMKRDSGIYEDDEEVEAESAHLVAADETGYTPVVRETRIDPFITGIPYDDTYTLGTGFLAVTNMRPAMATALQPIHLDMTTKLPTRTNFVSSIISSAKDYEQHLGTSSSLSLSTAAVGVSANVKTSSSMKFGLTSSTYVLHFEVLETMYRELDLDEYEPTLTALGMVQQYTLPKYYNQYHAGKSEAQRLDELDEKFRQEYGDYFVSGYQYGAMFDAYITIQTETSEQLQRVETVVQANVNKPTVSIDAKTSMDMSETLRTNNAKLTVEIRTVGIDDQVPTLVPMSQSSDMGGLSEMVQNLQEFRNKLSGQIKPEYFAPVYVKLQRYRSIDGMMNCQQAYLPYRAAHAAKISDFNRKLMALTGYVNTTAGLPDSQVNTAKRNAINSRAEYIRDIVNFGGNVFYTNLESIDRYGKEIEEIVPSVKAFSDRYAFWRQLIKARENESSKYNKDSKGNIFLEGLYGYKSFAVSDAVTKDIEDGKIQLKTHYTSLNVGWEDWQPQFTAETKSGGKARFCAVEVASYNNKDNHRRPLQTPMLGQPVLDFDFEAQYDRDTEWEIRTYSFNVDEYPFGGMD